MALNKTQVSQLYVAIFGRSSEGEGNTYWQTAVEGMSATATAMLETPAAKEYFGDNLDTNEKFISTIYLNTLGKTATEDPDGIAYWVGLLNDGKSKGEVVAALIEAAQDPKNAGPAQDMFNNKVTVSNYTADNIAKADVKDLAKFSELNNSVTSDPATVEAAEKAVDDMAKTEVTGETKYLEVTQDKLDGTAGNDLFVADVAQNQNGQQVNTLGSGDVIKGGAGYDTLDAEVTTGSFVNGNIMDIAPRTESVENIVLHAELNETTDAETVSINAKNMVGVEKIASNYSDASLVVKNMTTKGVSGGTASQTVAMEYTANLNPYADESDMTVLYDQDYLVAGSQNTNGVYYDLMNQRTKDLNPATNSLEKFPLKEVAFKINDIEYTLDITKAEMDAVTTYSELVTLLNSKLAASNYVFKNSLTFTTNGTFRDDENMRTGERIELVSNDSKYAVSDPSIALDTKSGEGNLYWNQGKIEDIQTNDPVKINVELEKVGLAADGGGLTIGSMNTDGTNVFEKGATTTDTREGFDQFDVTVKGNKTKNSSLSYLESTNNTLRKVTVESETRKDANYANLTIGNSNTGATINNSATAAEALKDVQVFDASSFKGDLTLNAGITLEIVEKYLDDNAALNLNGDLSLANEVALFDYNGGAGNDELNIFINNDILAKNFYNATATDANPPVHTTIKTLGTNVFEMNVNGGAGNDEITVALDNASTAINAPTTTGAAYFSGTNISINGGTGNDFIDISKNETSWTFDVAFNGSFGHDIIKGFNGGTIATTNEKQVLSLTGFEAHTGEVINVYVGDKQYSYTVKATDGALAGTLNTAEITALVQDILLGTNVSTMNTMNTTDAYFTGTIASLIGNTATTYTSNVVTKQGYTGKDIGTVKVEISTGSETNVSYEKVPPLHTATAETHIQGGVHYDATDFAGGAATYTKVGADVLDFSAYNAKGIIAGTYNAATGGVGTTIVAKANNLNTAGNAIDTTNIVKSGSDFIYLEKSVHNDSAYNVYLAKTTADNIAISTVDFAGADANANKGQLLGSIELDGLVSWAALDGSQFII